jgi:arylsulfatase A-like enzyme
MGAVARGEDGIGGTGDAPRVATTMAASEPRWPDRPQAPVGAPNVVVVLVDDVGFADLGCYGSEIPTPHLDRLATDGVQFTNFHATPMCSPTRASLLTGLAPHRAGVGHVAQDDPGFPGYRAELSDEVATMAEAMRDGGWATFAVGKWHLCRDADTSAAGPMHSWPCQRGFERFYGILDAFTNLHHPHQLVADNTHLDTDGYPEGFHLTDDLTEAALTMVRQRKAIRPDQPFLLYLAHPAAHAPLHARPEDIARHAQSYDDGWDEVRRRRFARQVELGIVPGDATLPERNSEPGDDVPAWESLDDDHRRLFARYMATYAAMVEQLDRSVGRLRAGFEELGVWEDTIVVFLSDNGASREGEASGTTNYFNHLAAQVSSDDHDDIGADLARIDLIGGPRTMSHYPRGWAMASNTPFRLYKRNTHAGGHQVPCIVHPGRNIDAVPGDGSRLRRQYAHVVDLWPTVAELAGLQLPVERNGRPVPAPDGVSLVGVLADAGHDEVRTEQLYELAGNRGLYQQGWEVVSRRNGPGPFHDGEWELYDLAADPTEIHNRADAEPDRVAALARRWDELARDQQVYPLDEGSQWRWIVRRPADRVHEQPLNLVPGTPALDHWRSARVLWHRTVDIAIELDHKPWDAGVLVAHGDQGGGYIAWVADGRVMAAHNDGHGRLTTLDGGLLPTGATEVCLHIEAPGGWRWNLVLSVDGNRRDEAKDLPMLFPMAPFEGISVGRDPRSPVHWDLFQRHGSFPFSGHIHRVRYLPGAPAPDHPDSYLELTRSIGASFE